MGLVGSNTVTKRFYCWIKIGWCRVRGPDKTVPAQIRCEDVERQDGVGSATCQAVFLMSQAAIDTQAEIQQTTLASHNYLYLAQYII